MLIRKDLVEIADRLRLSLCEFSHLARLKPAVNIAREMTLVAERSHHL